MIKLVRSKHGHSHQIATVWHPEPEGEIVDTGHGNVRVLTGPAAYQLATGELIEI